MNIKISLSSSLEDLAKLEDLSVRLKNICKAGGLNNLLDILNYYQINHGFTTLRNCGTNSEKELTKLCNKYLPFVSGPEIDVGKEFLKLSPNLKAMLLRHFDFLCSTLSVRSTNALTRILADRTTVDVIETIMLDGLDFKSLKSIGEKSYTELRMLKQDLVRFLKDLITLNHEDLIRGHSKMILKTALKNLADDSVDNVRFFDKEGKIEIFSVLDILSHSDHFLSPVEKMLFDFQYKNQRSRNLSFANIAETAGITRERVRQISNKLDENFNKYFRFVSNFMTENIVGYGVDFEAEIITIGDEVVSRINQLAGANFNRLFYSKILNILSRDRFQILGDRDLFISNDYTRFRQKWKQCYLIEVTLAEIFDFEALVQDVFARQKQRFDESYSLHFKGYISGYMHGSDNKAFERIQQILEIILFHELEVFVDKSGYLLFEKTTKKPMQEYCYEVLEKASVPLTIEDISNSLLSSHPELSFNHTSVRSTMNREREMFIYFGRTSTYGLRKWETEKFGIKGGTIRNIVEEYLHEQEKPQHVSELMAYLVVYRPDTTEKSLMANLKLDDSNRFRFFDGEHVGLRCKTYSDVQSEFKRVNGTNFRMVIFKGMNGWKLEQVTEYFVSKYGYAKPQVESILRKKIKEGYMALSKDQRLII